MLSISSKVLHHNLGLPSRHIVRWIGAVPFEYYRDVDGWHVQTPDSDKPLVLATAGQLSTFFIGMACDFGQMEPEDGRETISGYLDDKRAQDGRHWSISGTD